MLQILLRRNQELRRDLAALHLAITGASVPPELLPYQAHIGRVCERLHREAARNLAYLQLGQGVILDDVLSTTRGLGRFSQLLCARMLTPVLRARPSDRLCLHAIGWMHAAHPDTAHFPAGYCDGAPAVWPFIGIIPLYYFPCLQQEGLLFLPLLFHEFGHVLYACHKQEMDDLVAELRQTIGKLLEPPSRRNDRHAAEQARQRQAIVATWYTWTQEFFCDAVGLTIGGPAYLHAFSAYVNSLDPVDFTAPHAPGSANTHPPTWLRVRLLVARAQRLGWVAPAQEVEQEWSTIAQALKVQEDHRGFYSEAIGTALTACIEDMLVEAAPRTCTPEEAHETGAHAVTPVELCNAAWHHYRADPNDYEAWEASALGLLLGGTS